MRSLPALCCLALYFAAAPAAHASALAPGRLRCEYLTNPLGIDTSRPRLSWELSSSIRGDRQAGYQVIVASSSRNIQQGLGDLWDSGRVASNRTAHVVYSGRPLVSRQTCYWTLRTWDRYGRPSEWAPPASWEMGLLSRKDWTGTWIGAPAPHYDTLSLQPARWIWRAEGTPKVSAPAGARYFWRTFDAAPAAGMRALLRLAADDRANAWINNRPVGRWEHGWETMAVRDVTSMLRPGRNVLAIMASNDAGPAGVAARLTGPSGLDITTDGQWSCSAAQPAGWPEPASPDDVQPVMDLGPWGSAPWSAVKTAPPGPGYAPAPMLRKAFTLSSRPSLARVYVSGLGYYELRINGHRVGNHMLDPNFTAYDHRVRYVTYNVAHYLTPGPNVIGVTLGSGWYNEHTPGAWNWDSAPWRAAPKLLLNLLVKSPGGPTMHISTDTSWRQSTGPIVYDSIYGGETYDARLEHPGWDSPGFNASRWKSAAIAAPPRGRLQAQMAQPVRIFGSFVPKRITQPRPGHWVVDFGQNFAGLPEITLAGKRGTRVTMQCGERLGKDGLLDPALINVFVRQKDPASPFQQDTYILRGKGIETWHPQFTYHGFQYVEVTGFPGKLKPTNIIGRVMHTAVDPTARFTCSNKLLNQIQRSTLWSYVNNLESIFTDCPTREKNGWTGDTQLAAEQGMFNFDSAAMYTKWTDDLADAQSRAGELPGIVPTSGWGYGTGPAWDSAYVLVPWYLYTYFADTRILERHYAGMRRYVDYLGTQAKDSIVSQGLGDWVPYSVSTSTGITGTGYYYRDARILSSVAAILGKMDDSRRYASLAASIKDAFNRQYWNPETKSWKEPTQTALSCILYQGLATEENRAPTVAALVRAVESKKYHLDGGILGAKYVLNALMDANRADVAYRITEQDTQPSWGWWIRQGATTLWEDWKGEASLDHIMFGDVSAWFIKALAGIRPDPTAPGFRRFVIRPVPQEDLKWAHASYRSMRGWIASGWRRSGDTLALTVSVPPNTRALVWVPTDKPSSVLEGGKPAAGASGVKRLRTVPGAAVFSVDSGQYEFRSHLRVGARGSTIRANSADGSSLAHN